MSSIHLRKLSIVFISAMMLSACTTTRPAEPWQCALAGAGVGALAGTGVGVNLDDDKTDAGLMGAGIGAAAGLIIGGTICAIMPREQPPPVAAPPPPPRAPQVVKTVVLPGVHFAFDRSDLKPEATATLDREVVPELRADPDLTVVVEGHTDAVGSDTYNQSLSERRAAAVKSYLVGQGIAASRIESRGYGESQPVADNETELGRSKNRRVEIKELK
jgi:outer membrane protein OmpA-like peptidoglycan-associated protein